MTAHQIKTVKRSGAQPRLRSWGSNSLV